MEHFVTLERAIPCPRASVTAAADSAAQILASAGYRRGLGFGPTQSYVRHYRPTWALVLAIVLAVPTLGLGLLFLLIRSKDHCNVVIEDGPYGVVALVSGRVPASLESALEASTGIDARPTGGQVPPPGARLLAPSAAGPDSGQSSILRPAGPGSQTAGPMASAGPMPAGQIPRGGPGGYPPFPGGPGGQYAPHGQYAQNDQYAQNGQFAQANGQNEFAREDYSRAQYAQGFADPDQFRDPRQPAPEHAQDRPAAPAGSPPPPWPPQQERPAAAAGSPAPGSSAPGPSVPGPAAPVRPPSRLAPPMPTDSPGADPSRVDPRTVDPSKSPDRFANGSSPHEPAVPVRAGQEDPFPSSSGRVPWVVASARQAPSAGSGPVPPMAAARNGVAAGQLNGVSSVNGGPAPRGARAAAEAAPRPGSVATAVGEHGVVLRVDTGETLELGPFCLLGREPVAREGDPPAVVVKFDDAKLSVSKTHLAYGIDGRGLWVMDRNSTNGTTVTHVDGHRVACSPGAREYVEVGSVVQLGQRRVTVEAAPSGT